MDKCQMCGGTYEKHDLKCIDCDCTEECTGNDVRRLWAVVEAARRAYGAFAVRPVATDAQEQALTELGRALAALDAEGG